MTFLQGGPKFEVTPLLVNTIFHLYRVLNLRFVVRILTVHVLISEI